MTRPAHAAEHLSTCGWAFDISTQCWHKGEFYIAKEALVDLLSLHPWARPHVEKALAHGAIGFVSSVEYQSANKPGKQRFIPGCSTAEIHFHYPPPNAVLLLGELA